MNKMIFSQLSVQLKSLSNLISSLSDEQFTHRIAHLGNASIGGHTRHIVELLHCAVNGYKSGTVDYLNRERNLELQNNRALAVETIYAILNSVNISDKILKMVVEESNNDATISTTYYREIVYNTEHTIHHLALIKVALIEMNLDLVDNHFGMAYSTIKFKEKLSIAS
jgi:hypothetical protein